MEPDAVIGFLFGARYTHTSAPVLEWLAPAPLLFGVAYLAVSALLARDRAGYVLRAAVVSTTVNIALNVALIPRYSGVGAAIATTVSFVVQVLIVLPGVRADHQPGQRGQPFVEAAVASALLAGVLLLLEAHLLVELVVAGAVYAVAWSCSSGASRRSDWRS